MLLTAPLLWPEHEAPHDYHRFTRYALKMVFEKAGFTVDRLDARGGWHMSLASDDRNLVVLCRRKTLELPDATRGDASDGAARDVSTTAAPRAISP
jgi:hypothetical protein